MLFCSPHNFYLSKKIESKRLSDFLGRESRYSKKSLGCREYGGHDIPSSLRGFLLIVLEVRPLSDSLTTPPISVPSLHPQDPLASISLEPCPQPPHNIYYYVELSPLSSFSYVLLNKSLFVCSIFCAS